MSSLANSLRMTALLALASFMMLAGLPAAAQQQKPNIIKVKIYVMPDAQPLICSPRNSKFQLFLQNPVALAIRTTGTVTSC